MYSLKVGKQLSIPWKTFRKKTNCINNCQQIRIETFGDFMIENICELFIDKM